MLLNLSNHPSAKWSAEQRAAAERRFGMISDMPFPELNPGLSLGEITNIANDYAQKCLEMFTKSASGKLNAVHAMGEYTFIYQLLKRLESLGVPCVASTTERITQKNPDGSKTSVFRFVQFRPYF